MKTTPPARKPGYVFVARFFAVLILLYAIVSAPPVNERVIVPFTKAIVSATAAVLHVAREPIVLDGTVIRTPTFALDVRNGCNAVEAMMLLAAAMLAFPATIASRVAGLLAASIAIQLLNLIRVSSLVWLGEHHRRIFDVVHVAVWQTVVILAAVTMFVLWSVRYARKPLPARS
ncbi:MAG TPA: exosortase H [Thermoanaerobaculia bacterium]|jgi:exosortase H (IPTLxxWG-CTERM-specific)